MQRTFFHSCIQLTKRQFPNKTQNAKRLFTASLPRKANTLMEISGFSDTQLQVRDAISKICSNFPDVSSSTASH